MTEKPKQRDHEAEWFASQGAGGFVGGVTKVTDIGGDRSIVETHVGRPLEFDVAKDARIPADMLEHLSEILRQRDIIVADTLKLAAETPLAPAEMHDQWIIQLKVSAMKIAIDLVRQKYSKGDSNVQTAKHDGTPEADAGEGGTTATVASDEESGSSTA